MLGSIYSRFTRIRYVFAYAQTRYDINPRSRSEHIECVAHIELHQQHIENPRKRIYIDALRLSAQSTLHAQRCKSALGGFLVEIGHIAAGFHHGAHDFVKRDHSRVG